MTHQTFRTSCFHDSTSDSNTLPSSNSASPAIAIIRPLISLWPQALQPHVVLHQRREAGHCDAETDRAGRKVDVVGVLRPRRVRLRAAEAAEARQLILRLAVEEVLDGVEDRARVRLDRHPVGGPQHVEVERRHQGRHRRRRRLMATHLQPVARRPEMIRLMNHPDRQPEHLLLQRAQVPELGSGRVRWDRRCRHGG